MTRTYDCGEFIRQLIEMYGSLTKARICLLEACTDAILAANDDSLEDVVSAVGTFRFVTDSIALIKEKEAES